MFCTYITIYKGNQLPPFYIGYTKINNIKNKNYKGSPTSVKYKKIWKNELIKNSNLFNTIIIKEFDCKQDAKNHETYLQKHLNIHTNSLYVNLHISNEKFSRPKGIPCKESTKLKISQKRKGQKLGKRKTISPLLGRKHKPETIEKMKKPKLIPWSEERKNNKKIELLNKLKENIISIPTTKGLKYKIDKKKCNYCDKEIAINLINRYHNENCKFKQFEKNC